LCEVCAHVAGEAAVFLAWKNVLKLQYAQLSLYRNLTPRLKEAFKSSQLLSYLVIK